MIRPLVCDLWYLDVLLLPLLQWHLQPRTGAQEKSCIAAVLRSVE